MRRAAALLAAAAISLIAVAPADASHAQIAMFSNNVGLYADPAGGLQALRNLGVDSVRLTVSWESIAPRPNAAHPPNNFQPANPAAYPARNWAPVDAIIEDAAGAGIGVDLNLLGGAPAWARGPDEPRSSLNPNWEPNAADYEQFVEAAAIRYSGNYDPTTKSVAPGNPSDLPRVSFWSVWNEPDYGPSLSPQGLPGELTIPHSPEVYRGLIDAAWSALHRTGHGGDTFVWGELAPRGKPRWGVFSGMKPVTFIRSLYCVNSKYHPLRGHTARLVGCPATRAASARFRSENPGLFRATAVSDHPYSRYFAPNVELKNDPLFTSLADIGNLTRALDDANRAYGSATRYPIYNTEYGYITSPPKLSPDPTSHPPEYYISPTVAAAYLNEAEYISWRNPRIASFMQYLLQDPLPRTTATDYGGFASGLIAYDGKPKPTYYAWKLPLWLPATSTRLGDPLEIWGAIRPAHFALMDDPGQTQFAEIQFKPSGHGGYTTVASVPVTDPHGYFDTHVDFLVSGTVRVKWTYPTGDMLLPSGTVTYSRPVQITIH